VLAIVAKYSISSCFWDIGLQA